jgi:hypothetical protein
MASSWPRASACSRKSISSSGKSSVASTSMRSCTGARAGLDLGREGAGQRTAGRAGGRLGAGVDQVGHRLGLGQVELVVEEGALGELAGLGQAQAGQARLAGVGALQRRLQAARQQQLQHHRAAVGLQFQHVFAGVAVRRGKVQRQPVVDGRAIGIAPCRDP